MIPEKLVDFLNRFYSVANTAAKNTGGIIDKLLGDGILVLWGIYDEDSGKESHAMDFFWQLKRGLMLLNDESAGCEFPELKVGVGMSSGKTIVGTLGNDIKMEYTAVGSVVNLASRLEELCKVYRAECVVSSKFLNGLKEKEREKFDIIKEAHIKGVGYNIKMGIMK